MALFRLHARRGPCGLPLVALVLVTPTMAASTDPIYRTPDDTLVDIVTTPNPPFVQLSTDQEWLLLFDRPSLPTIAELSEPELKLAGYRIHPRLFGPSRNRPSTGYRVVRIKDGTTHDVRGLPEEARVQFTSWSPDGERIAFTLITDDGFELWIAEIASGTSRALTGPVLNVTTQIRPTWMADGQNILCTLRPETVGEAPTESRVPTGPVIQENLGEKTPARTYQDLLKDGHDEALFDHYFTSQLAVVSLEGKVTRLGGPGVIDNFSPSPDGRYILAETIHRPYSYDVPASRFPRRVEILDRKGEVVRQIADLPLHDDIPTAFGSVAEGPRSFSWRNDAAATLVWVEALDGGDASAEAEERDRLFILSAPFEGDPKAWVTLPLRYSGVSWGRGDFALVSEWWWQTRTERTSIVRPDAPEVPAEVLWDRSWEDRYRDPGNPVFTRNEWGRSVLLLAGERMHLIGAGASPEGDRPFYDTFDLTTRETERRFRSEAPHYELPVGPVGEGRVQIITRRESVDEVPNYFVRDLARGQLRQLTDFPHPSPQLKGLSKELIKYDREDGVKLTATLYVPPGHDVEEDGPLPMLMWAYPQEFKSADYAGQVTDSPYRFDRVGWWSPLLYLTQGYAVLDDPKMPIVGEEEDEPNDTFREQLVSSAKAAVEEVVRRGVAEEGRIAIGGHSYGAFMTANLLAHSDLFAAGIARSGAYNRTLTPFGFQAEERTLWEAPEVYFTMSPFMHAEKVNEPILLIHGAEDNNPGTYPMQSERYYDALKGHGAFARLVMLPKESHGYRSRESILHMLWEQEEWLDRYVKRAMREEPEGVSR